MRPYLKSILILAIVSALAGAGAWYLVHRSPTGAATGDRKVLYYQSAMHPWVKSDQPGRCTICGMELTPVYEGDRGFDAKGDVIPLTDSQVHVLNVQTSEAKVQPLMHRLQVAGMIDDDDTRHRVLSAYVEGRIEKLYANYIGAVVNEGEPLAEIYSPSLLAMEREYSALMATHADAVLVNGAKLKLQRMGLNAAQITAVPKKSPDVNTSQILAPMSGTIVTKSVYEGQYVTMGENLFELGDFTVMWFQFRAYEQDIPWIKVGQTVEVTTPSVPGRTFTGTIKFLDPNFDEATRSTKVRVELPNVMGDDGRGLLLHRLYADGVVHVAAPEVLAVPRAAVIQTGPEAVVYLDKGSGSYARTAVKTGRRGDSLIEIVAGLKAGEKVVTNGNLLIDGQAEMNRAFAPSQPPPPAPAPAPPLAAVPSATGLSLTDVQRAAAAQFIKVADAMAAALADEKLAAFNEAAKPAEATTRALSEALRPRADLAAKLDALSSAARIPTAGDLLQARTAFHKFTMAAIPVMEPLRTMQGAPAFKVWECFMIDSAIQGAPKFGRWVQLTTRPGHNPFLGPDMVDCVQEIAPGGKAP